MFYAPEKIKPSTYFSAMTNEGVSPIRAFIPDDAELTVTQETANHIWTLCGAYRSPDGLSLLSHLAALWFGKENISILPDTSGIQIKGYGKIQ